MSDLDTTGKPAYMYDEDTDTFYSIAGITNTAANYTWAGSHIFNGTVTINDVIKHTAGLNNFQNPSARDTAIASPSNGVIAFVRQDSSGNSINQLQFFNGTKWVDLRSFTSIKTVTTDYTLTSSDSGMTIFVNAASAKTVTIPLYASEAFFPGESVFIVQAGPGAVNIAGASGTNINGLNGYSSTSGEFAKIQLLNTATNTWRLFGDLA